MFIVQHATDTHTGTHAHVI